MNMRQLTFACLLIWTVFLPAQQNPANGAPARDIKNIGSVDFNIPHHQISRVSYDLTSDQNFLFVAWSTRKLEDPDYAAGIWIFDLSNPAVPRKVFETDLGKQWVGSLRVHGERLIFFTSRPTGSAFVVYDITKPGQPRKISEISDIPELSKSWPAEISPDGNRIVLTNSEKRTRVGLDIGDPSAPKSFDPPPARTFPPFFRYFLPDAHHGDETITDVFGPFQLSFDSDGALNFWSDGKVVRSFSPDTYVDSARILATLDAVLTLRRGHFRIQSTLPRPVTGRNLIRTHAKALAVFQDLEIRSFGSRPTTRALEAAGVLRLMDGPMADVSEAMRIRILNDYGYMLDWSRKSDQAVPVLRKVVELSPGRAVAHLNLADALQNTLRSAASEDDKASMWQEASVEYARYRELSGREAPKASTLAAFNLPNAVKSAASVCDYVADAFNNDGQNFIRTGKGAAIVDGERKTFSVGYARSSCSNPYIRVDGLHEFDDGPAAYQADDVDGYNADEILIVPFRNKSYVLGVIDKGPSQIVEPGRGTICTFRRSFTARLAENLSAPLCGAFLAGTLEQRVKWRKLDAKTMQQETVDAITGRDFASFDGDAEVTFESPGQVRRIGHFGIFSGAGCGCDHSGVSLIEGSSMIKGEPNSSLLELQSKWWICGGADAAILAANGRNYVELTSGRAYQREKPEKALLRLSKGKFEPMCRIRQVPRYTPEMK